MFAERYAVIGRFLPLFFLCGCFALFAQNTLLLNASDSVMMSSESASLKSTAFAGIWENEERFVFFPDTQTASDTENGGGMQPRIVLKPFYRFYYDGIYAPGDTMRNMPLAVLGDGIYAEFWTAHNTGDGIFWRPENNRSDFTIETVPISRELVGYYTSADFSSVYKIRYWQTNADFTEEKAVLHIPKSDSSGESTDNAADGTAQADGSDSVGRMTEDAPVYIDKYIKIGNTVYTCAVGRRTYVRNPEKLAALPESAHIAFSASEPSAAENSASAENALNTEVVGSGNSGGGENRPKNMLLVFGEPLLKRSKITDLEAEIAAHNALVYPPRNGRARFIEPSIYKKLEAMDIEDFKVKPLRMGTRQ